MSDKKVLVTICGPSTTGKSMLANLFKDEGYKEVVSTTTRPARTGEIEGVSYYFVDENAFNDLQNANGLVENEKVSNNFYGVSKAAISNVVDKGFPAVLVIAPKGANRVQEYCLNNDITLVKVYVDNPMDLLIKRLVNRYENDNKAKDEVYKDRLWNLTFIEPKEWTAKAHSGEHFYDLIFDSFTADNEKQVLNEILAKVDSKLNKTVQNKPKFS